MRWKPNVTVAAVAEHEGRFLLVEEHTSEGLMLNQPAGHLEDGESLADAVIREFIEETARPFQPEALTGIYQWRDSARERTFLRFTFCGHAGDVLPGRSLDAGIARTLWMTREEIAASAARHRSPWVLTCVDDYLAGRRLPLDLIRTL